MLRNFTLAIVILGGLLMTGLITYNYFFYPRNPQSPGETRGETAVLQSQTILRFSQGAFVDKRQELHPDISVPTLGYLAPDFELLNTDGKKIKLSDLRGKPVLVNFWATWCPPCRKEMPDLQAFYTKHSDKIQLLGINWGEETDEIKKFLAEFGVSYPNVIDQNGKMFVLYQLTGLPTSFFVDEAGVIRGVWLGLMTAADIEVAFEKTTRALEGASK
ncbi:TlpA family protein disulfide reductase [Candidatus Acetothermia bacterium]|nr:TlpA family protein disulfide reductase [Candidatus Acetothermia bacterium]MBI3459478.1 TlpA family protein disulfide reductase [Candidatus Acetothermia bacterium]